LISLDWKKRRYSDLVSRSTFRTIIGQKEQADDMILRTFTGKGNDYMANTGSGYKDKGYQTRGMGSSGSKKKTTPNSDMAVFQDTMKNMARSMEERMKTMLSQIDALTKLVSVLELKI
jgi:hypothetical protein